MIRTHFLPNNTLLASVFLSVGFVFVAISQESGDVAAPQYGMGMLIDSEKEEAIPMQEIPEGVENEIPSEMSLEDFVPKVESQGGTPTDAGWAVAYYAATTEWALTINQYRKPLVTAFAYDPIFHNGKAQEDTSECTHGVFLADVLSSMVETEGKRMNINKASCAGSANFDPSQSLMDFKSVVRLTGQDYTPEQNITAIKFAIASYHPVVFGMLTPPSFRNVYDDGIWNPTEEDKKNIDVHHGHAMTVVGYDDNVEGGAFRVVNSWGEEWGDGGYCWIKYEDFSTYLVNAFMFTTELKMPEMVSYGADEDGFGRKRIKKFGFYEGFLDAKGKPVKGIYMNLELKKGRGGARYMKKLVRKNGGYLIYSEDSDKIPIAAVIY